VIEVFVERVVALLALVGLLGALGCDDVCDGGGNVPAIRSADYDRSCTIDTDCVAVPEGDVCSDCALHCQQLGVVNKSAEGQYLSEVAKLVEQFPRGECSCPPPPSHCCVGGVCHNDQSCSQR
jgi:hypothetical protein